MSPIRLAGLRILIVLTALLGLNYIVWRWLFSVNWPAWWIAVPLVIAETYSLIDSLLFGLTMWRLRKRPTPSPPPPDLTVDVFITTYNEPEDLVLATAAAAHRIRYPHTTWILDDGDRPELAHAADELGVRYMTRAASWTNKPRHAKAGNLNNALLLTEGEYILVLDADQVPDPAILDRTLGYFRDEKMAIVQTPQYFVNVTASDPLGSQAPLFYGPIQQGKDGWNAAFFCGSNAVLRRDALMQLGIAGYVEAVERDVHRALRTAAKVVTKARAELNGDQEEIADALDDVTVAVHSAREALRGNRPLADVTYEFQQRVDAAARRIVDADVGSMREDLAAIAALESDLHDTDTPVAVLDDAALARLAEREWSPLGAIESVRTLIRAVDVGRDDEAQPVLPMATISVTEDMATCMKLHELGWRTAYHHENLAHGLAPEDAGTMLTQRLRWAQGTIQVMFRENPLLQRGLTLAQRLMYWATMWSYLSGFAAVVYIAAPVIYLVFGVMPVQAYSWEFFGRLVPFLVLNQLVFFVVSRGTPTWRGQQYSLALFPVWIKACWTAVLNVYAARQLGFAVTPKTRQEHGATPWYLVRYQLIAMAALVLASVIGVIHLALGNISVLGVGVNLFWVAFDLVILSVVIPAVRYRGFRQEETA
ncbi:glycosyltransferase [Rhodococcus jostii]|uniref:glycosyltransferase n=1 Tax=Rhodococcus jostii TaxID=132919 RepID=UPI00365916D1